MIRVKILLCCIIAAQLLNSCSKLKDPPPTDGDDRLTNHYCNDPRAVNFNWDFPGIPDNEKCVMPTQAYEGSWTLFDTVYFDDFEVKTSNSFIVNFIPTEDSIYQHMIMKGWCADAIYMTVDRFGKAQIDTLRTDVGQFICNDTLSGYLTKWNVLDDTFKINFTQNNIDGTFLHVGTAVKNH